MPIKVLAIFSAPRGRERLNIRLEKETLVESIKNTQYGHLFDIIPELHITLDKFKDLLKDDIQLIHFSGHSDQNYINFEKTDGTSQPIPINAFIKLIKKKIQSKINQLKCIIFNSCYSFKLGEELSKLGICTISMKGEIKERAARLFTEGFYSEFSRKSTIIDMFKNAQNNIQLHNLYGSEIPTLRGNENLKFEIKEIPAFPPELRFCIEDERNQDFVRVNEVYIKPRGYENALEILQQKGFLIITGPPNIGKTSTAYSLANTMKQIDKEISLIFSIRNESIKTLQKVKNSIIIFDDIFGKVKFDNEFQANEFAEYQNLKKYNNYLIYTTREEILLKVKTSRTRFGEFPDLDENIFKIEQEGFYNDIALEKILDNHLNYYIKQDDISLDEKEIAENNKFLIIEKLRFPHNYKELVEIELSKILENKINIKEAIDNANHIKRSVELWFTNMEDKSIKYFIFTLGLFQNLNLNVEKFSNIYLEVIELLKTRHPNLNVLKIESLLKNPSMSIYICKKGDSVDFIHPNYLEGVFEGILNYYVEDIYAIQTIFKKLIVDDSYYIRRFIIYIIGEIGKVIPEITIPLLIVMICDENSEIQDLVIRAFGKIGTKKPEMVLPLLKDMMKDEDPQVQISVAIAFGKIGTKKPEMVLPLLKDMMNIGYLYVRCEVVIAFGKISTKVPEMVLPLLKEMMKDKDSEVRSEVVRVFSRIGKKEPEIVLSLLKEMMKDEHPMVRFLVASVFGGINTKEPEMALSLLKEMMKDKDPRVRISVARTIAGIGKKEPEIVLSLLKEMVRDGDSWDRISVARAFTVIGTKEPEMILSLLKEMMKDEDSQVRDSVVRAFGRIGTKEPEMVLLLLKEMMKDENSQVRDSVVRAFGRIGTKEPEMVLSLLKEMMKDEDSRVRDSVVRAFGGIGTKEPEMVLSFLKEMMKDEDSRVRDSVVRAFDEIGTKEPKMVLPLLKEMMRDEDSGLRKLIVRAFDGIGTKEPEMVLSLLKEMMKDEDSRVRGSVARAFGKIGTKEPEMVLPLLKEMMKDEDSRIRFLVASAFGKIGIKEPEMVLSFLKKMMRDEDSGVRANAEIYIIKFQMLNLL